MDKIQELSQVLKNDKVKKLLSKIPKPEDPKAYTKALLIIAKKLHINFTPIELIKALREREQKQLKATEAAEEAVEASLSESALETVAGAGFHSDCSDTWGADGGEDENCWFNDHCAHVWNSYTVDGTLPACVYTESAQGDDDQRNYDNEFFHVVDDFDIFPDNYGCPSLADWEVLG